MAVVRGSFGENSRLPAPEETNLPPVVAFDLDMTLIDSRPSVAAALRALADERARAIDVDHIVGHLGPPIAMLLADTFGPEEIDDAVARFLDLYLEIGVPLTEVLPGAADAIDAVHHHGGRVVVITAKHPRTAAPSLAHVGLEVDAVLASRYGTQKRDAISAEGAAMYVGDTQSDVAAAIAAGCVAVGVASGPDPADVLVAHGAHAVLDSLVEFPAYFARWHRG